MARTKQTARKSLHYPTVAMLPVHVVVASLPTFPATHAARLHFL